MIRGLVVPLSPAEVVTRALYLAGETRGGMLDDYVRQPTDVCPVGYYRLKGYNGGKDPTASDPFDRWHLDGGEQTNITSDCMGGAAWCSGFDRYQPQRFAHIYKGWINTDSIIMDASGPRRCFAPLDRPESGAMIVCRSGSRGHKVGHVGVVVSYRASEWSPYYAECWQAIGVVDIAARDGRANRRTTGRGWFDTGAVFVRSIMEP